MNLILYNNTSDRRYLNKSISQIIELNNVTCLNGNSFLTPIFILSPIDNFDNVNYCYAPEFKRYYYVNDVMVISGNRIELHCNVDVLMSFKSEILAMNGTITRSIEKSNVLISDGLTQLQSDTKTVNKLFSDSEILPYINATNRSFVFSCYGGLNV